MGRRLRLLEGQRLTLAAGVRAGQENVLPAGLEMTVLGPRVRFLADTWIALTGADLTPLLDDEPVPPWQAVEVRRGGVLAFRGPRDGVRAYMAVAGERDGNITGPDRITINLNRPRQPRYAELEQIIFIR